MKATKRLCSVWVDTVGREIIVRLPTKEDSNGWMTLEKTPIQFEEGKEVIITTDPNAQVSASLLPVNNPEFPSLVQPGNILHIGRFLATGGEGGSLFVQVLSSSPKEIRCVAQNSATLVGVLTVLVSHREFELSLHDHDLNRDLPLMSPHDMECLRTFGADFEIDFLTLSYSNSAEDVWSARQTLDAVGLTQTKVIAKVERKAAIHNFDEIVSAADGILLSRGNLGLDFEPEEMALLQKDCVARCNSVGKPIVLTRFVDTMVHTPRPTRAEATDVANAVLDGVDAILLGAETLRGLYPVDTVQTVIKLCRAAEKYFDYRLHHEDLMGETFDEELSLNRAYPSSADFSMKEAPHPPPLNKISTVPSPASDNGAADAIHTMGSPGAMHGDNTNSPSNMLSEDRKVSSFGVLPHRVSSEQELEKVIITGAPLMSKGESIASSAVRTAEKINAGMILVLAQTGRTVSLVAKYRPPMPVLAVVVPTLRSSNNGWQMEGKFLARQFLVMRGVHPMLAAPMAGSEGLLGEAIASAHGQGLVRPRQHVVCILTQKQSLVVKVVQVNEHGDGIAMFKLGPENELDGIVAAAAAGAVAAQQEAGDTVGTPPSPFLVKRTSMSLAGAGAFSGDMSQLVL